MATRSGRLTFPRCPPPDLSSTGLPAEPGPRGAVVSAHNLGVGGSPVRALVAAKACPVLGAAHDLTVGDGPEGGGPERPEVLVRDLDLGDDLVARCHNPQHPD